MNRLFSILLLSVCIFVSNTVCAQKTPLPPPDMADVSYGPDERNVMDIWFAESSSPTPLVVYIHGGGFRNGSKKSLKSKTLATLLEAGISVAAINYRFVTTAPLPAPHYDGLRAVQYIRHHATEWNIDKERLGAFGGSAGAQICMWLAFSDEMANPSADDPIERESSRLSCVATNGGQTTLNLDLWVEWIPGYDKPHIDPSSISSLDSDGDYRQEAKKISAIDLISADDPPLFMTYGMAPDAPIPTNEKRAFGWKIHHVIFGIKLKEKMDELGVEADLSYPGAETVYQSRIDFFQANL
ncbi:MAG: alpha/beta hydrolase [Bacteroidota bacterium]